MKNKVVCHITTVHPVNDNRIFYKQCQTLKKLNFSVYFICAGTESKENEGITIVGLPKYSSRWEHFFRVSIWAVMKASLNVNASIYHIHDPELIFTGIILRIFGKKVIYDIHEDNSSSMLTKPYFKYKRVAQIMSKSIGIFEKFIAPFFSKIITARPDISEKFKNCNPTTINNFPIIQKIKEQRIVKRKENSVIIFVGGLSKIRGIHQLIESFQYIDDAELWLLGPWKSKDFQEECSKLNGWNRTKYLGVVNPDEIFDFIRQADIGIITFLPVPNHIKTLATKPFEYMVSGIPVIMSNFNYWKSYFGKVAVYVDPLEPKNIASSINQLLKNPDKMKLLGVEGRKLVQNKLNWGAESIKLHEVYKTLLAE